jgi:hypothetical protein
MPSSDPITAEPVPTPTPIPFNWKPGVFFTQADLAKLKPFQSAGNAALRFMKAWAVQDKAAFQNELKYEKMDDYWNNFLSPDRVYAFQHIEGVTIDSYHEVLITVSYIMGNRGTGEVSLETSWVCLKQNDKKQWKVYMLD